MLKENQEFLYAEIPKLETLFRILTENSWLPTKNASWIICLSAEERFEK
jgi:hypothetical protein